MTQKWEAPTTTTLAKMFPKDLWPMAIQQAVTLYNTIPKMDSGLSPEEIWCKSKSTHSVLRNEHPWGCPIYVLDPTLQDGQKIPKWKPRSRVGQYMGKSPLHASTVALVRNLQTGRISPQYHVVFDDNFETVYTDYESQPLLWEELLTTSTFKSDYDNDSFPAIEDEWLNGDYLR